MKTFTIIIEGIALSYLKGDLWKVLFPFDNDHTVRLRLQNGGEGTDGISLGMRDVKINISVKNPGIRRSFEGGDYQDFIDLTNPLEAHTKLKTKYDLSELDAVLLSIKNAEFSAHNHTDKKFRLKKKSGAASTTTTTTTPPPFRKIGDHGKAILTGDELRIDVTGPDTFTPFTMVLNESATVVIDNDCEKELSVITDDTSMLYKIVEDINDPTLKFGLEKAAAASPGGDPDGTATGLPCNMYRVSDPGGMP